MWRNGNRAERRLYCSNTHHTTERSALCFNYFIFLDAIFSRVSIVLCYPGAISELFDTLYDEDVVSDSTFFRWRDDRFYGEQMGRGVAINTLNQFFKWLEEDTTAN
jgi:eIF4-gamma/eIF5/eIF2-epsilon